MADPAVGKSQINTWIEHNGLGPSIPSVWFQTIWLYTGEDERHGQLCEGSPMTVTQYHLVDRTQTDFTLTNFALPAKVTPTS